MRALLVLASLAISSTASAQALTVKCEGQTWAEIAQARYERPELGALLAVHNRAPRTERCRSGRFVRLIRTIRHEVRLGQTLAAIVSRFYRAPGAEAFLRERLSLPPGTEPETGRILELPVELAVPVGARPARDLAQIEGLPTVDVIRRFNGLGPRERLPKGTVYVPIELVPKDAEKPPPPPPPPPAVVVAKPPVDERPASPARAVANPFPARFDKFLHEKHAAVTELAGCQGCHVSDPAAPMTYRPIDTKLCERCHVGFVPTAPIDRTERLALTFSHDRHLKPGGAVQEEYAIGCRRCHDLVEGEPAVRSNPGHAVCAKCHNASEVPPAVDGSCTGCHATRESTDRLTLASALLAEHYRAGPRMTDIRFTHAAHLPDDPNPEFEDLACDSCHLEVRRSTDLAQVEPMRMADCLTCHEGLERTLAERSERLDRCAVCHVVTREVPSPFLGAVSSTELVHSRTFARRHEDAARRDDGDCATCHVELSGGRGAECQRCHERVRPRDHSVRWREDPHGRAAIRDPERCATCHQEERCADCHSVAPRDHFPRARFRTGHGRAAQRSIRRCQTCHIPQIDCARCHDVQGT